VSCLGSSSSSLLALYPFIIPLVYLPVNLAKDLDFGGKPRVPLSCERGVYLWITVAILSSLFF
jgi:hypothetical protein